jgi:hypothetical protein
MTNKVFLRVHTEISRAAKIAAPSLIRSTPVRGYSEVTSKISVGSTSGWEETNMRVSSSKPTGFRPIKFTLTIESEDELNNLFHRMNAAFEHIAKGSSNQDVPYPTTAGQTSLWDFWAEVDQYTKARD